FTCFCFHVICWFFSPCLSPPTLTAAASNRVCNSLALLQCVASHPDTRQAFLNGRDVHRPKGFARRRRSVVHLRDGGAVLRRQHCAVQHGLFARRVPACPTVETRHSLLPQIDRQRPGAGSSQTMLARRSQVRRKNKGSHRLERRRETERQAKLSAEEARNKRAERRRERGTRGRERGTRGRERGTRGRE
ncbi:putative cell differentiation protein rcd1, partial [Toxoplasma gondii p89]